MPLRTTGPDLPPTQKVKVKVKKATTFHPQPVVPRSRPAHAVETHDVPVPPSQQAHVAAAAAENKAAIRRRQRQEAARAAVDRLGPPPVAKRPPLGPPLSPSYRKHLAWTNKQRALISKAEADITPGELTRFGYQPPATHVAGQHVDPELRAKTAKEDAVYKAWWDSRTPEQRHALISTANDIALSKRAAAAKEALAVNPWMSAADKAKLQQAIEFGADPKTINALLKKQPNAKARYDFIHGITPSTRDILKQMHHKMSPWEMAQAVGGSAKDWVTGEVAKIGLDDVAAVPGNILHAAAKTPDELWHLLNEGVDKGIIGPGQGRNIVHGLRETPRITRWLGHEGWDASMRMHAESHNNMQRYGLGKGMAANFLDATDWVDPTIEWGFGSNIHKALKGEEYSSAGLMLETAMFMIPIKGMPSLGSVALRSLLAKPLERSVIGDGFKAAKAARLLAKLDKTDPINAALLRTQLDAATKRSDEWAQVVRTVDRAWRKDKMGKAYASSWGAKVLGNSAKAVGMPDPIVKWLHNDPHAKRWFTSENGQDAAWLIPGASRSFGKSLEGFIDWARPRLSKFTPVKPTGGKYAQAVYREHVFNLRRWQADAALLQRALGKNFWNRIKIPEMYAIRMVGKGITPERAVAETMQFAKEARDKGDTLGALLNERHATNFQEAAHMVEVGPDGNMRFTDQVRPRVQKVYSAMERAAGGREEILARLHLLNEHEAQFRVTKEQLLYHGARYSDTEKFIREGIEVNDHRTQLYAIVASRSSKEDADALIAVLDAAARNHYGRSIERAKFLIASAERLAEQGDPDAAKRAKILRDELVQGIKPDVFWQKMNEIVDGIPAHDQALYMSRYGDDVLFQVKPDEPRPMPPTLREQVDKALESSSLMDTEAREAIAASATPEELLAADSHVETQYPYDYRLDPEKAATFIPKLEGRYAGGLKRRAAVTITKTKDKVKTNIRLVGEEAAVHNRRYLPGGDLYDPALGRPTLPALFRRIGGEKIQVTGEITPENWVRRVLAAFGNDAEEIDKAARWYETFDATMRHFFGEDAEAVMRGLAASQANASPKDGLTATLKAIYKMRRGITIGPKELSAARDQIVQAVSDQEVTVGFAAKLHDFSDSLEGKGSRTWLNDLPEASWPTANDIHALRDLGYVDKKIIGRLRNPQAITSAYRQGAMYKRGFSAKDIPLHDSGDSPGDHQNQRMNEKYTEITQHLNDTEFMGRRDWNPSQVQALGWSSIQRIHGARPENLLDAVMGNTRQIALEVTRGPTGAGDHLTLEQSAAVARESQDDLIELVNATPDVYWIPDQEIGYDIAGWEGGSNTAITFRVAGSPEAIHDLTSRLARAFDQGLVQAARETSSADAHPRSAFVFTAPEFADDAQKQRFFERLHSLAVDRGWGKDFDGFASYDEVMGEPAIMIRSSRPQQTGKEVAKFAARYKPLIRQAVRDTGIDATHVHRNVALLIGDQVGKVADTATTTATARRVASLDDPLEHRIRTSLYERIGAYEGALPQEPGEADAAQLAPEPDRFIIVDPSGTRIPMYPHVYDKADAGYLLRAARDQGLEAEIRPIAAHPQAPSEFPEPSPGDVDLEGNLIRATGGKVDAPRPGGFYQQFTEEGDLPDHLPLAPEPGTSPLKPGFVRLYHYTRLNSPERIRRIAKQGIVLDEARGASYGEPNMVWASTTKPEGRDFVEFAVHVNDPRWDIGSWTPGTTWPWGERQGEPFSAESYAEYLMSKSSNVTFRADITPEDFLAVHEAWMEHARYIAKDVQDTGELADRYGWIMDAKGGLDSDYQTAYRYLESTLPPPAEGLPQLSLEQEAEAKMRLGEDGFMISQRLRGYAQAAEAVKRNEVPVEFFKSLISEGKLSHYDKIKVMVHFDQLSGGWLKSNVTRISQKTVPGLNQILPKTALVLKGFYDPRRHRLLVGSQGKAPTALHEMVHYMHKEGILPEDFLFQVENFLGIKSRSDWTQQNAEDLAHIFEAAVLQWKELSPDLPPALRKSMKALRESVLKDTDPQSAKYMAGGTKPIPTELQDAVEGLLTYQTMAGQGMHGAEGFVSRKGIYLPELPGLPISIANGLLASKAYGIRFSSYLRRGSVSHLREIDKHLEKAFTGTLIQSGRWSHDVVTGTMESQMKASRLNAMFELRQRALKLSTATPERPDDVAVVEDIEAWKKDPRSKTVAIYAQLVNKLDEGEKISEQELKDMDWKLVEQSKENLFYGLTKASEDESKVVADGIRRGLMEPIEGVRWVNRKQLTDTGIFAVPAGVGAGKWRHVGEWSADAINDYLKFSILLSNPAYYPMNIVGNGGMLLMSQGALAPLNAMRAAKIHSDLGDYAFLIDHFVGGGLTAPATLSGIAHTGKLSGLLQDTANMLVDRLPRRAEFIYQAHKLGYENTDEILELLVDPKYADDLRLVSERVKSTMVDFDDLSQFEKDFMSRIIFVYPWLKGATVWSARFPKDHPIQALAYAYLFYYQQQRLQEEFPGGHPDYMANFIPFSVLPGVVQEATVPGTDYQPFQGTVERGGQEVPRGISGRQLATFSTPYDLFRTATGWFGDKKDAQQLIEMANPLIGEFAKQVTGYDAFKHKEVDRGPLAFLTDLAPWNATVLGDSIRRPWRSQAERDRSLYPTTATEDWMRIFTGSLTPVPVNPEVAQKTSQQGALTPQQRTDEWAKEAEKVLHQPVPPEIKLLKEARNEYTSILARYKRETGKTSLGDNEILAARAETFAILYPDQKADALRWADEYKKMPASAVDQSDLDQWAEYLQWDTLNTYEGYIKEGKAADAAAVP